MIRVIIEREVVQGLERFYEQAITGLLDELAQLPGYLAGESLVDLQRPNRYIVVTRWVNESSWEQWLHSSKRQQMLAEIRPFLLTDEKFTLLRQLHYRPVEQQSA